ncbi:MAG TPA: ABC transporter ATP-binding protein [Tepidisphaeraceae bacterium]|nr:ABC transporter ATP-binding protein [Tepidisphaeraceae bacterium]
MALLELHDVSKSYGKGAAATHVLGGVNLSVNRGEFLAIVGYSGAGKTTLLSLMAGLTRPDAGQVLLDGQPVSKPGPDRAVVFQNYSLLPWLSVTDNILLAVDKVFPTWSREERREHVARHVAMVNLSRAAHKRPGELSGGMRQRVSVARALATDPKVLLMDEPLSALDALTRATLQDEFARIWAGDGTVEKKTVVLITNDVDEAILLADRIVPLSAGPRATLGPSIDVTLDRPRDRAAVNHCPDFKAIRRQVFGYLLGPGAPKKQTSAAGDVRAPKLKPVDLSISNKTLFGLRKVAAAEV